MWLKTIDSAEDLGWKWWFFWKIEGVQRMNRRFFHCLFLVHLSIIKRYFRCSHDMLRWFQTVLVVSQIMLDWRQILLEYMRKPERREPLRFECVTPCSSGANTSGPSLRLHHPEHLPDISAWCWRFHDPAGVKAWTDRIRFWAACERRCASRCEGKSARFCGRRPLLRLSLPLMRMWFLWICSGGREVKWRVAWGIFVPREQIVVQLLCNFLWKPDG